MNDKKVLSGLMASLLLCFGGAAQAAPVLPTLLVPGVQNDLEDQSREAIVDVDGDGVFGVGDVLVGFARLDAITAPAPIDLTNRLYGIFSQQVTSVAPVTAGLTNGITFGPTTAAGLTLSEITGDGANAGQMLAVYGDSGGFGGLNLLLSSPGDLTTNGTVTLADYFSHILLTGTLELNATTADLPICAGGDCFDALVTTPAGSLAMACRHWPFYRLPDNRRVVAVQWRGPRIPWRRK